MKVATDKPYKLIYSLYEHQYLGLLFESFIVQLNDKGQYTYASQNISSKNLFEFKADQQDKQLVKYMDAIQQSEIIKKYNKKKKVPPFEFFDSVFGATKKDVELENAILNHVEKYRIEILKNLKGKPVFVMGKDGDPAWQEIEVVQETAKVYFHFDRQEKETYYYPIIKAGPEKVKFQFKGARMLSENPAFLLVENKLYSFMENMDGKKIKPFLDKPNIVIPRKIEANYFKNFVVPLVSTFNVFAKGFTISTSNKAADTTLKIKELKAESQETIVFDLGFTYGSEYFSADNFETKANVQLVKKDDSWEFIKIPRLLEFEKKQFETLVAMGLSLFQGRASMPKNQALSWLQKNAKQLEELNIEIKQELPEGKNYFVGHSEFDLEITEGQDWFDIKAKIVFGEFEIPFSQIRNYILKGVSEFVLPNGHVAVIPEEWFADYPDLFINAEEDGSDIRLKKQFIGMVQSMSDSGIAKTILSRKLLGLQDFEGIEDQSMPKNFKGELRPYQKAGYNWLHFLKQYKFGGCLADEMGLGKTVITLAFLQSLKEEAEVAPSILVMPTSLVYNWQAEAKKFTPNLKVYVHSGTNRVKSTSHFKDYDLIIMSYGVLRIDISFISKFNFNYAILDESQAIKNPTSLIAKTVVKLSTKNRIILTGTPLENSTLDLWSQYSFINPGLLGSYSAFKENYLNEIEKKRNEEATNKLHAKVKPFMLRRTKKQVAKDLPEKIETIVYSSMSEEQESIYEETKSAYRNNLLENHGKKGSSVLILQGLNKLRQIANHPKMIDQSFQGESGKENDVMHKLREVVGSGSKVLVFSQFVKHLSILKSNLKKEKIPYLYLDGSTKKRGELVEQFQKEDTEQVFLISLKAGGVGLNLTAANYVFILDPWWNPAAEAQAVDRAHRIGQENTVFTYKFISKGTVEEKIIVLQNKKKKLFDNLISIEETFAKKLDQNDLMSLLD